MPDYRSAGTNPELIADVNVVHDVLEHLWKIIDGCELRKFTKRRGTAKVTHGAAKLFGQRRAFSDLYLWHPSLIDTMQFLGHVGEHLIQVADLRRKHDFSTLKIYYHLYILGEESQSKNALSRNSATPNQIHTWAFSGFKSFVVEMELTGPALLKLCADQGKTSLGRKLKEMLIARWGSSGVEYGNQRDADGKESYKYFRMNSGVAMHLTEGMGWIRA
ncbi:MAG: hypothetical protein K8T89_19980 [Planctomycetes bacterium]|nr:hypothetical protein [Planctomycetota bacterium]